MIFKVFLEAQLEVIFFKISKYILSIYVLHILLFRLKLSITSDIDRSINGNDYLTFITHWIDQEMNLQNFIMCYEHVNEKKIGVYMSTIILEILEVYCLLVKVLSVTLNNTSVNTRVFTYLKVIFCLIINKLFHIRCACHVLNLIIRDGF